MDNVCFAQKCILYNKETKRLLILKRSNYKPHNAYLWDFFGGSVDEGEYSQDALKREGEEEIKVKINNSFPVAFYSDPVEDNSPIDSKTIIFGLFISDDYEFEDEEPRLSNEHIDYKWVSLEELDDYEFIMSINKCKDKIKPFIDRFYS